MARLDTEGRNIHVDGTVLKRLESTLPAGMSRTSWANYLIQVGLSNVVNASLPQEVE